MKPRRIWRPRRIDLLIPVGAGLLVPQIVVNMSSGQPADSTLVYAGLASIFLWAGVRLDFWRDGP